jgi:hypothetical protein
MRRLTTISSALVGIALLGSSFAQAADSKWYDAIGVGGYLQTSYVYNFANSTNNPGNQGRQFDTNGNSFNLNTFLLQISKPVADDKYGFTTKLRTGQDAAALNAAQGQAGNNFAVQEAYVSYAPIAKLTFSGGRFVTSEGYEGIDSVFNPNFSEGLLFTFAEPLTHTGLKANYVVSDKINATVGIVNGWDVAPDNNMAKTLLWQIATTPAKGLSWSFQGLYGKELADDSHSTRSSVDTVLSYVMGKLTLAGQANWGQQTNDPATTGGAGTTHWDGLGVWATFAETDKCSTSARFEVMGDQNNANRFGVPGAFTDGTTNQTGKEITLTQKHMFTPSMGARAEFRHDWSNQATFLRDDGSAVRNQNTISADWFVTF